MENEHNILLEVFKDLKAEFVAASHLEEGLLPEQILFRALGTFKRRSHRDIENSGQKEIGNFKGLVIESNRSGIYDYLPEQLFHIPPPISGKTLKKKIEDIRAEREKEQKTRLFFMPLEQEFFFNKVRISQIEQTASALDQHSLLFAELRYFWQIPEFVSDSTFIRLLPLLPEMSGCRADFEKAEYMLSSVLNISVRIEFRYEKSTVSMEGAEIGVAKLGADLLLGGAIDSLLPELQINLTLKNNEELEGCFTDPDFKNLVNWLLGWLLPVEFDYKINLLVAIDTAFLIAETGSILSPRLGYTTALAI